MIRDYENKNTLQPSENKEINYFMSTFSCVLIPNNGISGNNIKTVGYFTDEPIWYIDRFKEELNCKEINFVKLNNIKYHFYNIYHQKVEEMGSYDIEFTETSIIVNGKETLIKENYNSNYVYKIFKSFIKVAHKKRFIDHIVDCCNTASPWNTSAHALFEKLSN